MQQRPNILMITCHDLGRQLSCYGRPTSSPAIDRLAAEGIRFDSFFACAPQCSPSRACLMSGRWPQRTGVMGLVGKWGWEMHESVPTLAKVLAGAGYGTWLWGFQHEHPSPAALGYQHDPINYQRGEVHKILADYVGPRCAEWLASSPDGPWFAAVGFYETHLGWPRRITTGADVAGKTVPPYLPDSSALRQDMLNFDESLHQADRNVARILEALERSGQAANTIVIFTTDHGLPLPRAKCDLHDAGLEAALILRWPQALAANRSCSELLSGVDLMPTLLQLADVTAPADADGSSFAGLLAGGDYQPRNAIFAQQTWHDMYRPLRSVRTHRHKLIQRFNAFPENALPRDFYETCAAAAEIQRTFNELTPPRFELYDLASDPHELKPWIAAKPEALPAVGQTLHTQLTDWMRRIDDPLLAGPVTTPSGTPPPVYTSAGDPA